MHGVLASVFDHPIRSPFRSRGELRRQLRLPVESLPASDQLPAAPLLVTAYAFVWIAVMVYLWSIWRRLNRVEDEMRALAQKAPHR